MHSIDKENLLVCMRVARNISTVFVKSWFVLSCMSVFFSLIQTVESVQALTPITSTVSKLTFFLGKKII